MAGGSEFRVHQSKILFDVLMLQVAGVVAPGRPHHVIQRGNRRQRTFFRREDCGVYTDCQRFCPNGDALPGKPAVAHAIHSVISFGQPL